MANVVTNIGRAQSAGYWSNTVTQLAAYFGNVGTGAGTSAVTDTTLFTEVATTRISITPTRVTVTVTNDTAQFVFTYTATGSVSVTNAGYGTTNVSGAANIMQKSDHASIPLLSGDSVQYTFQNQQL